MSGHYSIAVGPLATLAHGSTHETLTVANEGTRQMVVKITPETLDRIHGKCTVGHGVAAQWIHVSPSQVTLAPNQDARVRVVATVPARAPAGHHAVLVAFTGQAEGHGNVKVQGSVTSVLDLALPGHSATKPCIALSVPHSHAAAWPLVTFGLVLIVALVAISAATRRIFRRRGKHS